MAEEHKQPEQSGSEKPDVLFVHLTDIHVNAADHPALTTAHALAEAIRAIRRGPTRVLVILSGDVAYSGKVEQYELFDAFLAKLRSEITTNAISLDICVSPGNHDCDYKLMKAFARRTLVAGIADAMDTPDISDLAETLTSVQTPFRDFQSRLMGAELEQCSPVQDRRVFNYDGTRIAIDFLNTAWASTLEDEAADLRFPVQLLKSTPQADVTIAVAHHPPSWFIQRDRRKLREWLDEHYDLIMSGHEHDRDDMLVSRGELEEERTTIRMLAGDAYHTNEDVDRIGFQALLWDRAGDRFQKVEFSLRDGVFHREDDREIWVPRETNKARLKDTLPLQLAFEESLDDAGLHFTHTYVNRKLKLDDIFVFPDIRGVDQQTLDFGKFDNILGEEKFVETLADAPISVIVGPEQSGRSTLAKHLYKRIRNRGKFPLLLDAGDLKSLNRGEITSWMNKAKQSQLTKTGQSAFDALTDDKKVYLIDNLDSAPTGVKGANKIFEIVSGLTKHVVAFSSVNPFMGIVLASKTDEEPSFWRDANIYELMEFGNDRRFEIIRKWVSLGRTQTVAEDVLEIEARQVKEFLDAALGKHGFPKYPLFMLLLLQQLETLKASKGSISSGSQGYLFELLITDSFDRALLSSPIGTVLAYLSTLARHLVDQDLQFIDEDAFYAFHEKYTTQKVIRVDRDRLLADLVRIDVLSQDYRGIGFKYSYYFHYFLARDIAGRINDSATVTLIDKLVDLVHTERSTQVLTFLAHFRQEAAILDKLLSKADQIYASTSECDLSSSTPLLLRFRTAEERQVLMEGPARRVSDHANRQQDMAERNQPPEADSNDKNTDPLQFNTIYKLVQVLGQILKSRAGEIDGPVKVRIWKACVSLLRRLLEFVYSKMAPVADEAISQFSKAVEEALRIDKIEAVAVANRLFAFLISSLAVAACFRAAGAICSTELVPLIDELEAAGVDETTSIILFGSRLLSERSFPQDRLERIVAKLKVPSELAMTVLQRFVMKRLFLNPPERHAIRAICDLMKLEVKALTLPPGQGRG